MVNRPEYPQIPPPYTQQAGHAHQPTHIQSAPSAVNTHTSSHQNTVQHMQQSWRQQSMQASNAHSDNVGDDMFAEKYFEEDDGGFLSDFSKRVGGKNSVKKLGITALLFFLLLFALASIKFFSDQSRYKSQSISTFSASLQDKANNTTRALNNNVAWMDNALSIPGNAQQTVNFISQNKDVTGVAIIDASGKIITSTQGVGRQLGNVSRAQVPANGVNINSLITDDGSPMPVIISRKGELYLVVALQSKSLVGLNTNNTAIVLNNGKVIDGSPALGRAGTQSFYEISPNQLSSLTNGSTDPVIISHKINGEKVWLGAAKLQEDSFFTVITTHKQNLAPGLKQNLILFGLMFIGMGVLIWSLLRQLLGQLDAVRAKNDNEEISRQRYRAAIDGSRGGVWEVDIENNSAYLSQSLAKLFGLPEVATKISFPQFLDLFTQADREKLYNTIRRAHVSGDFELELSAAQLPIYISLRGQPSVRGSDQAKVIIGVIMDITEMRGTQARLQAAEARLFDALRSMNDSFVIWDQMGRLVLWNNKFEDFFGFKPGNLQQGMETALVEYHANNAIESSYELADGTGYEIALKDGRWLRYLETDTLDGSRVSIGTEVTAIRSREAQLQTNQGALERTINILRKSQIRIVELAENYEQEKFRAEEANQSKSEFLANMSHELRTPLNAINGFSDIMKKELFGPLGDPRYKEYVNDILFSGQHLLSLINDILDMSKIEAGKMKLNTEALNINDMIEQVVRIVRGRADENRLKLIYHPTNIQEIEADPRAVKQILLNLTTNAIKFTPEGGVVTINVEPKSAGLVIHVKDTGIGISEEDIQRLAQPFEQIDSQHSRQHEGTGLGLALSKSLVQLHGGNFKISSAVGEGTTVTFTLPSRPPEQKANEIDDNKVGSEISRLAQDIANVLTEGEKSFLPENTPNAASAQNANTAAPNVEHPPFQGTQPAEKPSPYTAPPSPSSQTPSSQTHASQTGTHG